MDRRSFCAATGLALSAGCLQLQEAGDGDGGDTDTDGSALAPAAPADPVSSVSLAEAFTLEDRLRATFTHEGSFWGFVDQRLQSVGPDGSLEWESESTGDGVQLVPSTILSASDIGGSCVAFDDGRVFAGAIVTADDQPGDDERGALYAIDRESGAIEWTDVVERKPELVRPAHVVTAGDAAITAIDVGTGGDDEPWVLRALETESGDVRWEEPVADASVQYVTAHEDALYVSTDAGLRVLDPETGERTGRVDVDARAPHTRPGPDVLFCATMDGLVRVDLTAVAVDWVEDRDRSIGSLTADDVSVYGIDQAGYVTAFDRATGDQRWQTRLPVENVHSGGFVSSGTVLWAAGNDGGLYGLAAADGELLHDEPHDDFGFQVGVVDDVLLTSSADAGYEIRTDDD